DAAAAGLLRQVARHFPADVFARGLAATLQLLECPFTVGRYDPGVPESLEASPARALYDVQAIVLRALSGLGPWLAVGAVAAIGAASPRAGIAVALFALYFCGYPAVQFHVRHFFHLEIVAWWALVFVRRRLLYGLWRFIQTGARPLLTPA